MSITLIRTFEKQIKELDKSIERILKGVPQTLQTIPGVDPAFTAGIIAEMAQLNVFKMNRRLPNMLVYIGGSINLAALQQMIQLYCVIEIILLS